MASVRRLTAWPKTADLLLRKQFQNLFSFDCVRFLVSQLSIELNVSLAEETVQTHCIYLGATLVLLLNFSARHARGFRFGDCARQCS
jgi:hypothetical protein